MTPTTRGYAILGTPRSGSTHLCRLLSSTGVLGKPTEYLNPQRQVDLFENYPDPTHGVWEKIVTLSKSDNGVYGIKVFYDQFWPYDARDIHRHILSLPIVFLTRHDKLGQAISFAKALQTLQWNSHYTKTHQAPEYNSNIIDYCLNQILYREVSLMQIFAVNDIRPIYIAYEEFAKDIDNTIKKIAAMVGVHDLSIPPESPLTIQRDAINAAWRERYVQERGDPNSLHPFELQNRWARFGQKLGVITRQLPALHRWMHSIE